MPEFDPLDDEDNEPLDDLVKAREIRERTRRHYRINPEEDSNEQPG